MNLFSLSPLQDLAKRRVEQYNLEKIFDESLKDSSINCPHLVADCLFELRELNRRKGRDIYESSIFHYTSKIEKNLTFLNSIYILKNEKNEKDLCRSLPSLIEKIKNS